MSNGLPADSHTKIVVFGAKQIRRVWHKEQWFFSVVDIVAALTDSADPKQYIKKMRQRDPELDSYWGTVCTPLDLPAPDGKVRKSNCANTEGVFRIIQSIPSPKAEPFKRWLAQVGYVPDVMRELTTSLDAHSVGEGGAEAAGIHVAAKCGNSPRRKAPKTRICLFSRELATPHIILK